MVKIIWRVLYHYCFPEKVSNGDLSELVDGRTWKFLVSCEESDVVFRNSMVRYLHDFGEVDDGSTDGEHEVRRVDEHYILFLGRGVDSYEDVITNLYGEQNRPGAYRRLMKALFRRTMRNVTESMYTGPNTIGEECTGCMVRFHIGSTDKRSMKDHMGWEDSARCERVMSAVTHVVPHTEQLEEERFVEEYEGDKIPIKVGFL